MATFRTRRSDYVRPSAEASAILLKKTAYERFTHTLLNLGDLKREAETIDAICAIFDLEGFTKFCSRHDPHLALPELMQEFLPWLFAKIKSEMTMGQNDEHAKLYCPLPFFAKFMGDGVMFLWDTRRMSAQTITNVPPSVRAVCIEYEEELLPKLRRKVSGPPATLRAGVARGRVMSVGDGGDYVGPCINLAARLQKLTPGLSFSCARKGFDIEGLDTTNTAHIVALKKVAIRGFSDEELVYVIRTEFENLGEDEKALFAEP